MKKINALRFFIFLFFPIVSFGQIKLDQKISLVNGKVELLAPSDLKSMSDEMFKVKYRKPTRPELLLTDENGEVNLVGDLTTQPLTEARLVDFKNFQMNSLKKNRTDLNFLGDGVKTVNGKKVAYFKFISDAIDQRIFNYYSIIVVDGKAMIFTFNCIEKLKDTWEKTADEIFASIKVK